MFSFIENTNMTSQKVKKGLGSEVKKLKVELQQLKEMMANVKGELKELRESLRESSCDLQQQQRDWDSTHCASCQNKLYWIKWTDQTGRNKDEDWIDETSICIQEICNPSWLQQAGKRFREVQTGWPGMYKFLPAQAQ